MGLHPDSPWNSNWHVYHCENKRMESDSLKNPKILGSSFHYAFKKVDLTANLNKPGR